MTLDADLTPTEHEELVKARDAAIAALHLQAGETLRACLLIPPHRKKT